MKNKYCEDKEEEESGLLQAFTASHLDAGVLVHAQRGSVSLMVPLRAVVVPVIPRGALPVHHLQGLQASGQRGEGG